MYSPVCRTALEALSAERAAHGLHEKLLDHDTAGHRDSLEHRGRHILRVHHLLPVLLPRAIGELPPLLVLILQAKGGSTTMRAESGNG